MRMLIICRISVICPNIGTLLILLPNPHANVDVIELYGNERPLTVKSVMFVWFKYI